MAPDYTCDVFQALHAVGVRHLQVRHDQVVRISFNEGDSPGSVFRGIDFIPLGAQKFGKEIDNLRRVIND